MIATMLAVISRSEQLPEPRGKHSRCFRLLTIGRALRL
jgi:hypothetical protein